MLIGFASMAAFVMMESQCALFLSRPDTFGWGPRNVGWFFTMIGVVIILVQGGLIGRLTRWLGEWPLAVAGAVFVAIGMACFVRTGYRPWLPLLLLGGCVNACGRSLQGPTVSSLVSQFADAREQGAVFGLFHGLSSFARVIGPVAAGFVYERHPTGPFAVAGVMMLGVALWTAALRATAPARDQAIHAPAPADAEATTV
jgi:MFS family permease